jgi:hypothetical protein
MVAEIGTNGMKEEEKTIKISILNITSYCIH